MHTITRVGEEGSLWINHVVLAELHASARGPGRTWFDLAVLGIGTVALDDAAAVRAGKAHGAYRANGGPRRSILADLLIGAHAAELGYALLTRDRRRFATYFPELTIIAPEEALP